MSEYMRPARPADIAGMHRVRMSVRENRLVSTTVSEDDYRSFLETNGRGWLIESSGDVVAFAIADADAASIWALFVDPAHEGKGYGRRLHDAMVTWLWEQGSSRLWLTTDPGTRAARFYEAAGWQCVGSAARGEIRFEMSRPVLITG